MMIFLILVLLSGCYFPRTISGSDFQKNLKSFYEVHAIDTTCWIYKTRILNDTLIGIIGNYKDQHKPFYTKVYVRSESLVYFNPEKTMVSIPLSEIVAAEKQNMPNWQATLLGIGIGMAFFYLLLAISGLI